MPVMTLEIRRVRISTQVLPMSAITSLPTVLTSGWPSNCFAPSISQRYRMALYRPCGKSIEMIRLRTVPGQPKRSDADLDEWRQDTAWHAAKYARWDRRGTTEAKANP